MSEAAKKIKDYLNKLTNKNQMLPIECAVKSVDESTKTCTVVLSDDFDVPDVRLSATVNSSDGLVLIPKVNTKCIIISLKGDLNELYLLSADEYEKVIFKSAGVEFLIDTQSKKFTIKNQQTSLHDVFAELKQVISTLAVATPSGPSTGLLPTSVTALNVFETKFKLLLNN